MSVQAKEMLKTHFRQIRQYQVGFAPACVFRLPVSECGKQQAQKGRHGFVLTLQEGLCTFLDGSSDFLNFPSSSVRADDLTREKEGGKKRKHIHAKKKPHPIQNSHMSSQTKV
jgi:hypothetical protein